MYYVYIVSCQYSVDGGEVIIECESGGSTVQATYRVYINGILTQTG